ncbi:MAG: 4-hydroxy-tetrahydrodipicolinate synthase [Bacillota bacterium]|nr:4-hydroxy-tetrahydrodipicolinate synthase [Bacillota bacterium]MDW7678511.1 4-hydroxy-tetrahydrodipicolinate synthase [Bacillota bacterium]
MDVLKGTYTVMVTPMTASQEVDLEGLKANIDWYVEEGIPGICVCGGTGEFLSLSKEERLTVAETAVKHAAGRIKCLVGTASESTEDTIFYTKHAADIGADGVMIINPYYCRPSAEEVYAHFKAIAEAVDIPIMAYNNPAHSGVDLTPDILAKLATIKNVDYVKDASGDLRRVSDISRLSEGNMSVFCGAEDLVFDTYYLGAIGWICVCGNIIPKEAQMIFDLIQENRTKEAKDLYLKYFPLLDTLENKPKAIQKLKKALDWMGRSGGASRLPRLPLTDVEEIEWKALLKELGII